MDIYAENILDHYKHPRNVGVIDGVIPHREENASCGDDLSISIVLAQNILKQLRWEGKGCALSQAAMSILSEELLGKTLDEIDALTPGHVTALLGVPIGPRRLKCALLSFHTLKNALRKSRGLAPQTWAETIV